MKCEDFTNDLISLVYGEIDTNRERKLREHLKTCKECRTKFEELKGTRELLTKWEDEESHINYVFIRKESFFRKILNAFIDLAWPKKLVLSSVTAVFLLLIFLAAANTTITKSKGTWQISMSLHQAKSNNTEAVSQTLKSYQKELIVLVSRMIEESEARQQKITDYKLVQMADHFNRARQTDLVVLGKEMEGFQRATQGQLYKTNEVLSSLIQLASYQYEKQRP